MKATRSLICADVRLAPPSGGIWVLQVPAFEMYALGSVIDCLMNAARAMFPSPFASVAGALSRFGPIEPVEPAAVNVWHAAQPPVPVKIALPAATSPPELVVVVMEVVVVVGVEVDPT